jgi:two-component system phosphate regulon sensor histidine kinase PhoR
VKFAPAIIQLRRAQLSLMLAVLFPTVLMTAVGIVLLATGSTSGSIAVGIIVLSLCTTGIAGYILGTIFVGKGASLARVQNDFLSSVSHEVRTPLTSMYLLIESLRDGRLEASEQKHVLALLGQELQRLDKLAGRLLELTRLETGRHPFEMIPLEVAEVVAEAISGFHASTLTQPTEVKVNVPRHLVVVGDRSTLIRALINLLVNAWKYTEEPKHIEVAARPAGRWIEISVSDNGIGIPADEQRSVFEGFSRGRAALERGTAGMGLGLAFVRAIARSHRGKIDLHPNPGGGTTFRLRLPRRRRGTTQLRPMSEAA